MMYSSCLLTFGFLLSSAVVNGFSSTLGVARVVSSTSRSPTNNNRPLIISLAASSIDSDGGDDDDGGTWLDASVSKPMGLVLEEILVDDEPKGVYCMECKEDSSAYAAGIRRGDVITTLGDMDVTEASFEEIMGLLGAAESPVVMTLQQGIMQDTATEGNAEADKKKKKSKVPVKMQPRKLPTVKKLMRASTNVRFWKDPLMIGSLAFTVLAPLSIYVASIVVKQ